MVIQVNVDNIIVNFSLTISLGCLHITCQVACRAAQVACRAAQVACRAAQVAMILLLAHKENWDVDLSVISAKCLYLIYTVSCTVSRAIDI